MLPTVIQLVALLDLLLVLAAVLFSGLLAMRRSGADGEQARRLRGLRRAAFLAAAVGFLLTLVLIMVDLLFRTARQP